MENQTNQTTEENLEQDALTIISADGSLIANIPLRNPSNIALLKEAIAGKSRFSFEVRKKKVELREAIKAAPERELGDHPLFI